MIENLIRPVFRQSYSKIADAHLDHIALVGACSDDDATPGRRQTFHRIKGINDQIKQDLLDLNESGFHFGELRIELCRDDAFP